MTIEQRLSRLERQNRRLKFGGMFLLLGIGAVFLMGQAKGVPEEIKARKFTLVDEAGDTRAILGITTMDTASLSFWDGEWRVNLGSLDGSGFLHLRDKSGAEIELSLSKVGSSITVSHDKDFSVELQANPVSQAAVFHGRAESELTVGTTIGNSIGSAYIEAKAEDGRTVGEWP